MREILDTIQVSIYNLIIMKLQKNGLKRIVRITLITITSIIFIVSIGGGIYLFDYAIVRKPPLSNNITPSMSTLSSTMAQSRIDGKAWREKNNAECLTLTANDGFE
jgi:hypothetical protein